MRLRMFSSSFGGRKVASRASQRGPTGEQRLEICFCIVLKSKLLHTPCPEDWYSYTLLVLLSLGPSKWKRFKQAIMMHTTTAYWFYGWPEWCRTALHAYICTILTCTYLYLLRLPIGRITRILVTRLKNLKCESFTCVCCVYIYCVCVIFSVITLISETKIIDQLIILSGSVTTKRILRPALLPSGGST